MKCPYCETNIQVNNMNRHTTTKRCRGIRRQKQYKEGNYEDVFIEDNKFFFSQMVFGYQVCYLGELTEEEFELKFLRKKDMT